MLQKYFLIGDVIMKISELEDLRKDDSIEENNLEIVDSTLGLVDENTPEDLVDSLYDKLFEDIVDEIDTNNDDFELDEESEDDILEIKGEIAENIKQENLKKKQLKDKLKNNEIKIEGLDTNQEIKNPEKIINKVSKKNRLIKQQDKKETNKKLRQETKEIEKEYLGWVKYRGLKTSIFF